MFPFLQGREARPAGPVWNVAKTMLQTGLFWLVFLVVIPAVVYTLETWLGLGAWRFYSLPAQLVGAALFLAGGSLSLWSGLVMAVSGQGTPIPMDCPRALVVKGPYRHVRNPMALGGLSQGVAVGLLLGSPAVVLYALVGAPMWNYLVRPWEEKDLEARFGEPYRTYRASIRCWLPSWRAYKQPN